MRHGGACLDWCWSALKKDFSDVLFCVCAEAPEEEVKLSVACCLPMLSASSGDRQQRAFELFRVCQLTSKHVQNLEPWLIQCPAQSTSSAPRLKLDLSEEDLKGFMDLLLTPESISGKVKVGKTYDHVGYELPRKDLPFGRKGMLPKSVSQGR